MMNPFQSSLLLCLVLIIGSRSDNLSSIRDTAVYFNILFVYFITLVCI